MPKPESSEPSITQITRRKIFQIYSECVDTSYEDKESHVWIGTWSGELDEVAFLSRLYMLNALPSNDSRFPDAEGDIYQHRINNLDWDPDWVFSDPRFNLRHCGDAEFLRFLAETLHPEVRSNPQSVEHLAQELNAHLTRDGWELVPTNEISGYPIYGWQKCEGPSIQVPSRFPLDLDAAVASVAEVLKHRGHARELTILANSTFQAEQVSFDNWNGGTRGWGITFALDASLYARLTDDELFECEMTIKDIIERLFRPFDNDRLDRVVLTPHSRASKGWQEEANRWLSGEGINNQGRVRSDNIASLECDGLLFRSPPEINLYRSLKQAGVTFAPLPVFLRGGESYARLEPDFLILKDKFILVVEVDGDTYHRESPADAHKRLLPLDHEGAKIERITAADCDTPQKAQQTVEKLLRLIERLARQR